MVWNIYTMALQTPTVSNPNWRQPSKLCLECAWFILGCAAGENETCPSGVLRVGHECYSDLGLWELLLCVRESRVTACWTYVLLKGRKNSKNAIRPITVHAISMTIQISKSILQSLTKCYDTVCFSTSTQEKECGWFLWLRATGPVSVLVVQDGGEIFVNTVKK